MVQARQREGVEERNGRGASTSVKHSSLICPPHNVRVLRLIWQCRRVPNNAIYILRALRRNKSTPLSSHRERSTRPQRKFDVRRAIPPAVLPVCGDEQVRALRDVFRDHGLRGYRVGAAVARPRALVLPRRVQEPAHVLARMLCL